MRAVAVTSDLFRRYVKLRQAEGRSNATINREMKTIGSAFGLAVREERLTRKPHIEYLPETNVRRGFFEAVEHEQILRFLPKPRDDIARFGYACGWRRAEIRLLRWENVDRKAREVRLDDSKNGDGRVLPLVDETWAMFERLWTERQYSTPNGTALLGYVFHKRGRPVGDSNFTKRWQTARNRAGLPGKLFHDSRRTAARNMIRAGVPQTVAMSVTGHRTDSMFRRHDITTTTDKREA